MDGAEVGWIGLGASLLFVVISLGLSAGFHLSLSRPIVVAVARSLVQMVVVGAALVPIVDPDTPLAWSWLWVVGIVVFSAVTVTRRAPQVPGLLGVTLVANAAVAV